MSYFLPIKGYFIQTDLLLENPGRRIGPSIPIASIINRYIVDSRNFGQMVRNNPELARDSLFIRKIKNAFKATELSIVQKAYAVIIADELFPHLLWQNLLKLFEIRIKINRKIAYRQNDLNFPFVLLINTGQHFCMNIPNLIKWNPSSTSFRAFF